MNVLYLVATKSAVMGSFPRNNFCPTLKATKMPEMDPLKECSYLKATKKVKVHGPGKK